MVVKVDRVLKIIEKNGEQHQKYKAAEELAELQTVVLQEANKECFVNKYPIIEEIADVYVMLKQLELIYKVDDRDIQEIIDYKIARALREV